MKYSIEYSNLKAGSSKNLDNIKISGPISFTIINMNFKGQDINIELFGDQHESVQGLCSIDSIESNLNYFRGDKSSGVRESKYMSEYYEKQKDNKDVIFIKDYLTNKDNDTQIMIEATSEFKGDKRLFCNIRGEPDTYCNLNRSYLRSYSPLFFTSKQLSYKKSTNINFVDIRGNLEIMQYLTSVLLNKILNNLLKEYKKNKNIIKDLKQDQKEIKIKNREKDSFIKYNSPEKKLEIRLEKKINSLEEKSFEIYKKIHNFPKENFPKIPNYNNFIARLSNFLTFISLDNLLASIDYFKNLSNFADDTFKIFIKNKFLEKTFPYNHIYDIFQEKLKDQKIENNFNNIYRSIKQLNFNFKDIINFRDMIKFDFLVILMDLYSILSIFYAIESKKFKNFVLYQGDDHINNITNFFKILQEYSLTTSPISSLTIEKIIEDTDFIEQPYDIIDDARDQEIIPANRCIQIDLGLYNKLNPQLQTTTVVQSSSEK